MEAAFKEMHALTSRKYVAQQGLATYITTVQT